MKKCYLYIAFICLLALSAFSQTLTRSRIDHLVSEIKSDDEKRCSKAAIKLAEYGPEAKAAIPGLIEIIQSQNLNIYASSVFPYIAAEEPVENILQLLEDENELVQSLTTECLKRLQLSKEKTLEVYIGLLNHDNPFVSLAAAKALSEAGAGEIGIDRVIQIVNDEKLLIKTLAVSAIDEIGIANEEVKQVLNYYFTIADKPDIADAASIYQNFFPNESKGITQLKELLKDDEWIVRWRTARAIGNLKTIDLELKPLLESKVNDENEMVAVWVSYAMIQHDIDKDDAWKVIEDTLESKELFTKISAINVLWNLGPAAKGQQAIIIKMLNDKDELVQIFSINALSAIRPSKELALPALENIMKTTDDFIVWRNSKRSIEQIKTAETD